MPQAASSDPRRRRLPTPTLAAKVIALRRRGAYPGRPTRVRMLETHFSCLFLVDDHVFKLKKPLRGQGLDHRSLASRERDCRRELRINRRLAPEVYLDVLPLRQAADGSLALAGAGRCVDWTLRMRRLPEAATLEAALQAGTVRRADARAIAATLTRFFAAANRPRIRGAGYRRLILASVAEAARRLSRRRDGLDPTRIARLANALRAGFAAFAPVIDTRVHAGCVVDGHGDLRPEHIYLGKAVQIIDAIEFDARLRCRDRLDDIAFLALECVRAGRPDFAAWLVADHRRLGHDDWPRGLLALYMARHAFNRARIALWHLDDPASGPPRRWQRLANRYLSLADELLRHLPPSPGAHVPTGVPATRTPSRTRSPG